MSMKGFWLGLAVGTIFTCLFGQWVFSAASKETEPPRGIYPDIVADYKCRPGGSNFLHE